jgi:predicted nuclease of predicted toxin-antitoxin system
MKPLVTLTQAFSEVSHWRTDEQAVANDEEVIAAAEPSMAMCPDGGLLLR